MTECLDPAPTDRVLEIGTGSGYQAAVLSGLVARVYTIEIVESLGRQAAHLLKELRYDNVTVKLGDGFKGWPEHAPFDKIIVTCSPEDVPQPLVDQLKEGGRMIVPVGERYQQTMYLFRKTGGRLEQEALRPTLFVPMTGQAESEREVQPDPTRPSLVNASFEEEADRQGFVPGWYYQRQMEQVTGEDAPSGSRYVRFRNDTPGQDAHVMQGLAIDGRIVPQIRLGCWVKLDSVTIRNPAHEGARVVVSFYDQDRRDLGVRWMGPWQGDQPWQTHTKVLPVPATAREMIIRIGLFGATGSASFDDLTLQAVPLSESKTK
jgi:protein-L-isoaspartate(D-aspartate) O-methyltransferase